MQLKFFSYDALSASLVILFFVHLALHPVTARTAEKRLDYYNRQVSAFLSGQIHFLSSPPKELLALPDPYEIRRNKGIIKNASLGVWDLSLYQGRLYMYFGVVPALALFLPYRLVTFGHSLPLEAAVCFFCIVGVMSAALTLRLLARRIFPLHHPLLFSTLILCLGVFSWSPLLIDDSDVYSVAVAGGVCFMSLALYCFMRASLAIIAPLGAPPSKSHSSLMLPLGALCAGLAVGCRPHYLLSSTMLVGAVAATLAWHCRLTRRQLFSLLLPLLACIACCCLYNYLRFGNFTEFGTRYQLTMYNAPDKDLFQIEKFWQGLYYLLAHPLKLRGECPWLGFSAKPMLFPRPRDMFLISPAGLFFVVPLLFYLAFLPAMIRRRTLPLSIPLYFLIPGAVNIGVLSIYFALIPRYTADFALLLSSASALAIIGVDHQSAAADVPRVRALNLLLFALLALLSTVLALFVQLHTPVHFQL